MRHLSSFLFNLLATVTLAGCASAPLSFVQGTPQTRTDTTLYPVRVVSIDGSIQFNRPDAPIQLAPGGHWMTFEAAPGQGARNGVQKSFALKIEPCQHYYLAAKRESAVSADWSLVVDKKEPVAGCNPEEESKKAGITNSAVSSTAPASSPQ